MKFNKLSSKIVLLICLIIAAQFYLKFEKVLNNSDRCICSYDGFGYYMYNPYLFSEGSLNLNSTWAKEIQNTYCDSAIVYQFHPVENGNELNIYHMGLSFVQLPAYLLADISATIFDYKRDGFSKPYHLFYLLNTLFFIFLGLFYFKKLLLLFYDEQRTSLLIVLTYLGTNLLFTFVWQYDLTHLYIFSLNAIFLFHLFSFIETNKRKNLLIAAAVLGLTVCIRPTQVLFGILPVVLFLQKFKGNRLLVLKKLLWFPLFGFMWNIPQIYYWYTIGGHFLAPNMHTEELIIIDPNLSNFLFSFKKGWLLYSPIFILLPIGFYLLFKTKRTLFWASFIFLSCYIWVMSSWECWWYASSFGSRVMIDVYPLLAIVLGTIFVNAKKTAFKVPIIVFSILCVILSLFQSYQISNAVIDTERMTKAQYWHVFGKTSTDKIDFYRLEIDRGNTDWIYTEKLYNERGMKFSKKTILSFQKPMTALPYQDLSIDKFSLLEKVPTDETCFIVNFKAKTSDSTKSAILRMETVSKFNCYGWDMIEISKGQQQNQYTDFELVFNLRNLRHTADQMQVYIDNNENATVIIKDFRIKAISLMRK